MGGVVDSIVAESTFSDVASRVLERFERGELERVKVTIRNSGVHSDGAPHNPRYWVTCRVTVEADGETFEFSEDVPSGPMWGGNESGAKIEEEAREFIEDLYEAAYKMAEKLAREQSGVSEFDGHDDEGNPYVYRGDKTLYFLVAEYKHFDAAGVHIMAATITKPRVEEAG